MKIFYVYAYLREDGSPYYFGKGCYRRAFSKARIFRPPSDRSRIVFLEKNLSEEDAYALEQWMIAGYGRLDNGTGTLRNLTDGGDGASNVSQETIAKRVSKMIGRVCSEETKRKIGTANRGKRHTVETCKKLSAARKGLPVHTEESKQKIGDYWRGRKRSETNCINMSLGHSKGWSITLPSGDITKITNLSKFCRENGLQHSHLIAVADGTRNHHKGYRAERDQWHR